MPSHTRSFLFPLKVRPKAYKSRPKIHTLHKDGKIHKKDDPGGTGTEIVKEIQVCASCYEQLSVQYQRG